MDLHASDCSIHNGPAYPPGPCDCGADAIRDAVLAEREACAQIANYAAEIAEVRGDLTAAAIAADIRARSKD